MKLSRNQMESRHKPHPYYLYESAKRDWILEHPDATPREYEAAMRELARRFGV